MEKKEEFIRVGTTLYKIVNQPRIDGGYVRKRVAWNSETLRQDYGKDYMAGIPKYDGFCTVPDHVGYQSVVGKFLNLYEPISHVPVPGDFPCIRSLVEHIFGEQYGLGMDYLQLLYLYPVQKLPILLLVSEERNTGKSTFLNFLKAVFQNNVTFNTNEDFRSRTDRISYLVQPFMQLQSSKKHSCFLHKCSFFVNIIGLLFLKGHGIIFVIFPFTIYISPMISECGSIPIDAYYASHIVIGDTFANDECQLLTIE